MAKVKIDNYLFDASAKTIQFLDYSEVDLDRILLITNVTDNIIIYNFADTNKGGTVVGNIITLDYNVTGMSDTDDLLIFYQDKDSTIESEKFKTLENIENILLQILNELKIIKKYNQIGFQIKGEIKEGD